MKRSEAFPSTYLSKDDVDPPITATIKDVYHVNLKGDAGDETKTAMSFVEPSVKPMIVNNANWMTCEDLYGEDSDGWAGHKVEIYKDPTIMFGGKRVGGVRVRKPAQSVPPPIARPLLPFAQAVAECATNGISEETLRAHIKAYLQEHGFTGYAASRDSAVVYQLIDEALAAQLETEVEI